MENQGALGISNTVEEINIVSIKLPSFWKCDPAA